MLLMLFTGQNSEKTEIRNHYRKFVTVTNPSW